MTGRHREAQKTTLAAIWQVLKEARDGDTWTTLAEISKRTQINKSVCWDYMRKYFVPVMESTSIPYASVKVVRLKPGASFDGLLRAIEARGITLKEPEVSAKITHSCKDCGAETDKENLLCAECEARENSAGELSSAPNNSAEALPNSSNENKVI